MLSDCAIQACSARVVEHLMIPMNDRRKESIGDANAPFVTFMEGDELVIRRHLREAVLLRLRSQESLEVVVGPLSGLNVLVSQRERLCVRNLREVQEAGFHGVVVSANCKEMTGVSIDFEGVP